MKGEGDLSIVKYKEQLEEGKECWNPLPWYPPSREIIAIDKCPSNIQSKEPWRQQAQKSKLEAHQGRNATPICGNNEISLCPMTSNETSKAMDSLRLK